MKSDDDLPPLGSEPPHAKRTLDSRGWHDAIEAELKKPGDGYLLYLGQTAIPKEAMTIDEFKKGMHDHLKGLIYEFQFLRPDEKKVNEIKGIQAKLRGENKTVAQKDDAKSFEPPRRSSRP